MSSAWAGWISGLLRAMRFVGWFSLFALCSPLGPRHFLFLSSRAGLAHVLAQEVVASCLAHLFFSSRSADLRLSGIVALTATRVVLG